MLVEINVLTIEEIIYILSNPALLCAIASLVMIALNKGLKKLNAIYKFNLIAYIWVVIMCSSLGSMCAEFFRIALESANDPNRLIFELGVAVTCIALGVLAQKSSQIGNEIIYRMIGVTAQSTGVSILGRYAISALGVEKYFIITAIVIGALILIDAIIYFGKIKDAHHFSISTIKLYFSVFTTASALLSAFDYCQGLKQKMDELEYASKKQKDSVVIK